MGDVLFFVVVECMVVIWVCKDGDIVVVVCMMICVLEFRQLFGGVFKDLVYYVVFVVCVMYGDRVIVNMQFIIGWFNCMGEGFYVYEIFDGYVVVFVVWIGLGQMLVWFEIVWQIGVGV